ncbi:TolC family protein [Lacihabitans sp. LS3-19]|uniref:TolC family protein n=1 Tax=Lacihabitans sp. LS3-19 TaxID=2487335 RepID=UPI0020CC3E71|nr:TolC family protein [Lacihabitans sp. LS3-19]MCP9770717.1 TolC family protein [Lacihabitans sp. LS3-19]
MKKRTINWLLAAFLLMSSATIAQDVKIYSSLSDIVQKAIDESKTMKVERTKVEISESNLKSVQNAKLPDLNASSQFMFLPIQPNFNLKFGQQQTTTTDPEAAATASPNPKFLFLGQLSASYPIFTGYKIKNNLIKAQQGIEAIKISASMQAESVAWQTIQLCFSMLRTDHMGEVLKGNLVRQDSRIKDFQNFVDNGILSENDLLKAKLLRSNVNLSLEEVLSNRESETYKFNTWLNQDIAINVAFDVSNEKLALISNFGLDIDNRSDLALLNKRVDMSQTGIALAKAAYYPNIALTGGYIGLNIDQVASVTNAFNIGIGLKYNIASLYKNKTEVKTAQLQLKESQLMVTEAQEKAKIELNKAIKAFELNIKKVEVYKEALNQASENLRIVTNKNQNGLADTDQLLEADVQQLQAEINYKLSQGDRQIAWYQVLYLNGTLLDYLKIKR